jgi:hypothetical protein
MNNLTKEAIDELEMALMNNDPSFYSGQYTKKKVVFHLKTLRALIKQNEQMKVNLQKIDKLCNENYYEDDGANFYVDIELLKPITSKYQNE